MQPHGSPCSHLRSRTRYSRNQSEKGRRAVLLAMAGVLVREAGLERSGSEIASGVTIDPDQGAFLDYKDQAMKALRANGSIDIRAIVSDRDTLAISWVFGIAEELISRCSGRIIRCDAGVYGTGFREVRLVLDKSPESVMLPHITPAEHFRVIVHPLASGKPYDSYLQECKEAFHNHKVFGITGMASRDQAKGNGIDYCIRIAHELMRSENATLFVSSGWVFGPGQYALDIVLVHDDTPWTDVQLPDPEKWSLHSKCKLVRSKLDPRWLQ